MNTILVDLGASAMRYAAFTADGTVLAVRQFRTNRDGSLVASLKQFSGRTGVDLRGANIWISTLGPFLGDRCTPLNLPGNWDYSPEEVKEETGAAAVVAMHDSLAYALSVPHLPLDCLIPVWNTSTSVPPRTETAAVIRLGIGLGGGALVKTGSDQFPVSGEPGNAALAAMTAEEFDIISNFGLLMEQCGLRNDLKYPSAEALLSGRNIPAIYKYLAPEAEPPSEYRIVRRARYGTCQICIRTMELYAGFLGTFAASMALTYDPPGGLYIFGEIPRRFNATMHTAFRHHFNQRGSFTGYMANIPVFIVNYGSAPFLGLQAAMRKNFEDFR